MANAYYAATQPTLVDGQPTTLLVDQKGALVVNTSGATTPPAAAADGTSNPTADAVLSYLLGFNGSTWDRIRTGLVAVQTTMTGIVNALTMLRYNLTPPTLADGNAVVLQGDVNGNLKGREQYQPVYEDNTNGVAATHEKPINATTYSATAYDIIAKATAGNIKASAGNLYRLYVTNDNAALQAYALVNKATAATTGDTAVMYFYVPLKSTIVLEWKFGKRFSTGIAWAQVTTFGAGTITTTTSDSLVSAEYI